MLVVRGEAGVGKSALLDYAAERAEGGPVRGAAGAEWEMGTPESTSVSGRVQDCASHWASAEVFVARADSSASAVAAQLPRSFSASSEGRAGLGDVGEERQAGVGREDEPVVGQVEVADDGMVVVLDAGVVEADVVRGPAGAEPLCSSSSSPTRSESARLYGSRPAAEQTTGSNSGTAAATSATTRWPGHRLSLSRRRGPRRRRRPSARSRSGRRPAAAAPRGARCAARP